MKKSTIGKVLGLFAVLILLSLASVSAYGYNGPYSPYSNYNDNYYKETHTLKSKDTDYFNDRNGYGTKTTTTNKRIVIERYDYPQYNYGNSCDRYYYSYDCNG